MVPTRLAALSIVLVLAFGGAGAHHCTAPTTRVPEATIETPEGTYYVDHECPLGLCVPWGVWVYEETNGIPGLQRADEQVDDTCHGMIRGDTVVF